MTDSMVRYVEEPGRMLLISTLQLIWDYLVRGHQTPADLATMPS